LGGFTLVKLANSQDEQTSIFPIDGKVFKNIINVKNGWKYFLLLINNKLEVYSNKNNLYVYIYIYDLKKLLKNIINKSMLITND